MSQPFRTDVILDIESLGRHPGAPVLEIGAVMVSLIDEEVKEVSSFHTYIDLHDALTHGRVEADTLAWWMKRDQNEPRKHLLHGLGYGDYPPGRPPTTTVAALLAFDAWLTVEGRAVDGLWGNGASFDMGLLNFLWGKTGIGLQRRFDFRKERDVRTLYDLEHKPEREYLEGEVAHTALADARAEARRFVKVYHGQDI